MSDRTITINDIGDKIPDLSTLPKRMRYAADVLEDVIRRDVSYGAFGAGSYTPRGLRDAADRCQAEDRANAERRDKEEELARIWPSTHVPKTSTRDEHLKFLRPIAGELIESGWRKGDPT